MAIISIYAKFPQHGTHYLSRNTLGGYRRPMKPRRHRIPPAPVVVHVHPSGDRARPWCNRTYEVAMPVLGANGVATAYSHRVDADRTNWCLPDAVMGDPDNRVDSDDFCVFEVDDDLEVVA